MPTGLVRPGCGEARTYLALKGADALADVRGPRGDPREERRLFRVALVSAVFRTVPENRDEMEEFFDRWYRRRPSSS